MRNVGRKLNPPGKARKTAKTVAVTASRFRDFRWTANLSVADAAKLLRVSERTIHNWEAGRVRIPYAAYKLLRIVRGGEFAHPAWRGWFVRGDTLWSPENHGFRPSDSSWWSLLIRQAHQFRCMVRERVKTPCVAGGEAAAPLGLSLYSTSGKLELPLPAPLPPAAYRWPVAAIVTIAPPDPFNPLAPPVRPPVPAPVTLGGAV